MKRSPAPGTFFQLSQISLSVGYQTKPMTDVFNLAREPYSSTTIRPSRRSRSMVITP